VYGGQRVISESTVALFTRRSAGTRALGWDTCGQSGSCGTYMSERAYGHTGFTGTSIWIDPDRDMFVVLLTNRVHDARAKRPATVIADVRADLADAAVLAVADNPDGMLAMPKAFRADRAVNWNTPLPRKPVAKAPAKKPATTTKAATTKAATTKAATTKAATTKATTPKAAPPATKAAPPATKAAPPATKTAPASSPPPAAASSGTKAASGGTGKPPGGTDR
jgi:hypothetical protein